MPHPRPPAEVLDCIVDFLQDDKHALRSCCLVSKSWIPRTRKHLFAQVWFLTSAHLQSWKKTFSDPSTSPACYANLLSVYCPGDVTAADATDGGWIPTFSAVAHLQVDTRNGHESNLALTPFHGFSHTVKTLYVASVDFSPSRTLNLACSFPLLESLSVCKTSFSNRPDEQPTAIQPSSAPAFTGFLEAYMVAGLNPLISRLLSLPISLRLRKLILTWWSVDDISLTMGLVERCRPTLESLRIDCKLSHEFTSGSIDLSEAANLEDVDFSCNQDPKWIVMALRTISGNHNNFRRVSLLTRTFQHVFRCGNDYRDLTLFAHGFLRRGNDFREPSPEDEFREPRRVVGETAYKEWLELDCVLVKLWGSHSICPLISYEVPSWSVSSRRRLGEG